MINGTPLEEVKGIGSVLAKRLRDQGIPSAEFLARCSHTDLSYMETKVTLDAMKKLISNARNLLDFEPIKGIQLAELEGKRFTTGLSSLDRALLGGFQNGSLIEVYGASRGGKTILSSQLAVRAQLPEEKGGLETKILWISTQHSFHHLPIRTMALRYGLEGNTTLDNITVQEVVNLEHFLDVMKTIPQLLTEEGIRFIVIDSLGSLFEIEYSSYEAMNYLHRTLSECLSQLRTFVQAVDGICLYTNPVFQSISTWGGNPNSPMNGHTMAHGSDYRLYVRRVRRERRKLMIQKGPGLPEFDTELLIGWGGLYEHLREVKDMNDLAADIVTMHRNTEAQEAA